MHRCRLGWVTVVGAALVVVMGFSVPASAKKFQMSGTWIMRKGQTFIPLQFALSAGGANMTHVSKGNLTEAIMTPNGALVFPGQLIKDTGVVTPSGSPPTQTLMVRQHRFVNDFSTVLPLVGTMLIQITTMFGIDAPANQATLAANGGPGNLTWCPSNPACVATGLPPGPTGNNGRVIYKKKLVGSNQFGGTMQMGLKRGGLVSVKGGLIPAGLALHLPFGGLGNTIRNLAIGGPNPGTNTPATEKVFLAAGTLTAPVVFPASGSLITQPGPIVGMTPGLPTPNGTPNAGPFYTTVNGGPAGQFTTNWAFGHTTGTVIVQQVTGTGGDDFFTVMGSDNRTSQGGGNITTVAGGLAQRNTAGGATRYAQWDKVSLVLGPTVPSMSPAGLAAAGALMLLAVGYALRRRSH